MGSVLSFIASSPTTRPDLVLHTGQVFEGYQVRRTLDSGGMGVVYEASEVASDDRVAIKLLLPGHAKREDFVRRFQQECRVYPKLKHPNIVRMRRADVSRGGVPFIVMDLVEGRTLRALMEKHRFDVLNALYVMSQVAHAMQFAHEKGIEHRDLKPENLMIATKGEEKGHVYVLDFGIAKMAGGMTTDDLPALGTARYMAPEQARSLFWSAKGGKRAKTDHRLDIYAFGVIFYELVTGGHPFLSDGKRARPLSLEEVLAWHLEAEPKPAHALAYGCPTSVWEVIKRCIAVDPDARYQSFQEVVEALRALINEVIERERVPREHALVRQLEEEKERAVQQAAFEVIAQKEAAAEAAEAAAGAAGAAAGGGEAAEVRRAHQTAPLGDFVPGDEPPALPDQGAGRFGPGALRARERVHGEDPEGGGRRERGRRAAWDVADGPAARGARARVHGEDPEVGAAAAEAGGGGGRRCSAGAAEGHGGALGEVAHARADTDEGGGDGRAHRARDGLVDRGPGDRAACRAASSIGGRVLGRHGASGVGAAVGAGCGGRLQRRRDAGGGRGALGLDAFGRGALRACALDAEAVGPTCGREAPGGEGAVADDDGRAVEREGVRARGDVRATSAERAQARSGRCNGSAAVSP